MGLRREFSQGRIPNKTVAGIDSFAIVAFQETGLFPPGD
jgi:hypothetical protein